jgi:acyl CoA:acetate/3-ketoacid CoA transferase beta subunit
MGVFEKLDGDEEFTLTKYFANRDFSSTEEMIKKIKENCGWDLKVARELKEVPSPTLDELRLLRVFDPQKYYIK